MLGFLEPGPLLQVAALYNALAAAVFLLLGGPLRMARQASYGFAGAHVCLLLSLTVSGCGWAGLLSALLWSGESLRRLLHLPARPGPALVLLAVGALGLWGWHTDLHRDAAQGVLTVALLGALGRMAWSLHVPSPTGRHPTMQLWSHVLMWPLTLLAVACAVWALGLGPTPVDDGRMAAAALWINLLVTSSLFALLVRRLLMRMEQLTRADPLTGLANRRALEEALARLFARHRRGEPFALVLIDMDRFKSLNDQLGHAAGDAALLHAAQLFQPLLRADDVLARWGGEEFALLVPEASQATAAQVAERLRHALASSPWQWQGTPWTLSASFGVADVRGEPFEGALHAADLALRRAKQQGRNRVICATPADWEGP